MKVRQLLMTALVAFSSLGAYATDAWLYSGQIGGTYIYNSMSEADLIALLDQRAAENVSILELDSRLSYYLTETEFDAEVAFLDQVAELADVRGMKSVIYYPSFEVLTANAIDSNGVIASSTMATDHPEWLQQGIDGTSNVFYGGQEVWVSPGEESAWMSPNSGYKDYFINRIEKLAATDLDGVWLDVPIYLDTGTLWTGTEPDAAADFTAWTIAEGLNGGAGYSSVPTSYDMADAKFRAWIKWRHINVANFLNDVRAAAQAINPNFAVVVENFPLDYFDSTAYGLDASYLPVENNFIRVWETDNVSNSKAMQWSTPDDFENKIAMLKWGKSVHSNQPSWSFSYGYEPLDAGLTMAATVASQNVPFESKTPTMLNTVDAGFRTNWFGYVSDHQPELFQNDRVPELAIWYSSATRDFQDYDQSGKFGIFSVTTPPTADDTWWANRAGDSVVTAPHLGGYRGLSAAMMRMHIPYTIVHGRDAGPLADSSNLDMLILPSVGALSDADAQYIRQYVQNGGVLLATGELPGTLDETGAARTQGAINDLFNFPGAPGSRVNQFGSGLAIYRPDILGKNLFGEQLDSIVAADTLSEIETLVRIHVSEPFTIENGEGVYADRSIISDSEHALYLVNYSGLQLPLVQAVKTVSIFYHAPNGKMVTSVTASSPDVDGLNGFAAVTYRGSGVFKIEVPIDQFALLKIQLSDAPTADSSGYAGPNFEDPAHAEAAQSGLSFVLNSMRNSALPEPNRYGVHTNLLDNNDSTEIYTNGHNVTGEHMGLLLRTTACMNDQSAFNDAFSYIKDLMQSPLYHVPNWSIDKNAQRPFLFFDDFRNNWFNANAPLDDLRMIHGLVDGYENFGHTDANALADSMFEGLLWTTVTDRDRNSSNDIFPQYAGGLLGFAWDWSEVDDNTLTPTASVATGTGFLGTDLVPVDYQDLGAIAHAADRDHRWDSVLQSTTQLLLDSEIGLTGLYYNGYQANGAWTGDFEYQGTTRGEHLKTIQVLWTAIHLARVSKINSTALNDAQKTLAQGSARRSLAYFKNFYQSNSRIPEYLTFDGNDVENCVNGQPANCLGQGTENLFNGEARIYAQIARLALLLQDKEFSNQIINEKIITDRVSDTNNPRYGMIGLSTAGTNDAEAWNVLESVFSLCLNALDDEDPGVPGGDNTSPTATTDNYSTNEETPLLLSAASLLANDTDAENDSLSISGLPSRSANGGSVVLLDSGDWRYTPASGFTGADSIDYAISDGKGGTGIGKIEINVILVPKSEHLSESATILIGDLNYGSVEFLNEVDADTYDIDSTTTAGGNVVDWYISGQIENRHEVSRLLATFSGHYSVPNVSQETYLFNFANDTWVLMDTRIVGDESDSVVRLDIVDSPQDFIAANGETRLRVRGVHSSQAASSWANSLSWLAYRGEQAPGTGLPIATNVSVSSNAGSAVAITLEGNSDSGGALTYAVDSASLTGLLTGTAPSLTYTPAAGFTGVESFSYTVSNGTLSSLPATVSISVLPTGVISNLASSITLDGNLNDWSGYIPFPADPADVNVAGNPLDWLQAWMAHDGGDYYIAYKNQGAVNVSWGQTIYFDIDGNPATGFQQGLPIGADRVLQGRFLYSYAGTGSEWQWDFITEVLGNSSNGNFEYRFPRSAFDNSELIQLVLVGTNEPYGGLKEDLYPDSIYDSSGTNRFLTYTATVPANSGPIASDLEVATVEDQSVDLELQAIDSDGDQLTYSIISSPLNGTLIGTAPMMTYQANADFSGVDQFSFQVSDGDLSSRVATVSIVVQSSSESSIPYNPVTILNLDGNLDEWNSLQAFDFDPNDVTGAENPVDLLSAAMAHDETNFYLNMRNDGQDLNVLQDWLFTVYLDTDDNPATGYTSGLAIGADYMQQGTGIHSYNGSGPDWTWTPIAGASRQANGSDVELSFARQSVGDPSTIKLVLIGDNLSLGGGVEDQYPDGTYDGNSAFRYLEYTTRGDPSALALGAAVGNLRTGVSGREMLMENAVELNREQAPSSGKKSSSGSLSWQALLFFGGLTVFSGALRRRRLSNTRSSQKVGPG